MQPSSGLSWARTVHSAAPKGMDLFWQLPAKRLKVSVSGRLRKCEALWNVGARLPV